MLVLVVNGIAVINHYCCCSLLTIFYQDYYKIHMHDSLLLLPLAIVNLFMVILYDCYSATVQYHD